MAVTEADTKMNEVYSQMSKAGGSEMPLTEHASVNPSLRPEQGDGFRIASPASPFDIHDCMPGWVRGAAWPHSRGPVLTRITGKKVLTS